jgi:hypothetical protein
MEDLGQGALSEGGDRGRGRSGKGGREFGVGSDFVLVRKQT